MKIPNRMVLKLNADWHPHQITPWQDVIHLLIEGTAEIMSPTGDEAGEEIYRWPDGSPILLRSGPGVDGITPKVCVRMPSVVRLKRYVSVPKRRRLTPSRHNILQRDLYTCRYCGDDESRVTIDHVWPRSRGGLTTFDNCVAACERCQAQKRDRPLSELMHSVTWNDRPFRLIHVPTEVRQLGLARFVYRVNKHNLNWLRYIPGWEDIAPRIGKGHLIEEHRRFEEMSLVGACSPEYDDEEESKEEVHHEGITETRDPVRGSGDRRPVEAGRGRRR